MIHDLGAVLWKEWKELLASEGRRTATFRYSLMIGMLGVMIPLQAGRIWVDAHLGIGMAAWVPVVTIMSVIADAFAGERERHTLETLLASRLGDGTILLGKILAAVMYAFAIVAAVLLTSLITVNIADPGVSLILFPAGDLAAMLVAALLSSLFAASAGTLVSLRAPTVRHAQQVLSVAAVIMLILPIIAVPALPDVAGEAAFEALVGPSPERLVYLLAVFVGGLDAILLSIAFARFRRSQLVL